MAEPIISCKSSFMLPNGIKNIYIYISYLVAKTIPKRTWLLKTMKRSIEKITSTNQEFC